MRYYVSTRAQTNGDHEVHAATCDWLPGKENRVYLGEFDRCAQAVVAARRQFAQSNGCFFCAKECHTS